ncbi:MAG TPA: hypothetical protein PLH02_03120 [Bacillota bacterium]|nr:hypothetical protein [Bacillota bacterium]HPJ85958.1 hypothetical protein [Bacillota bacterium]HPQ61852.1 hypothetical protein [Bacillota bacterium]
MNYDLDVVKKLIQKTKEEKLKWHKRTFSSTRVNNTTNKPCGDGYATLYEKNFFVLIKDQKMKSYNTYYYSPIQNSILDRGEYSLYLTNENYEILYSFGKDLNDIEYNSEIQRLYRLIDDKENDINGYIDRFMKS